MHGRLKVKTTAQQKAERHAERLKKMDSYEKAMARIVELRSLGPCSEEEALKLTNGVLHGNPDLSTLWNFRKEIYLGSQKKSDEILQAECEITKRCLEIQPKSYCTWHHRLWVLSTYNKDPSFWDLELRLCNTYLTLDERNFHCWDYRRFVLTQRNAPDQHEEELNYSMDRIKTNFSNYSAWHYRSKLLEKEITSNESIRNSELILTQHAAFTDPEDSSPRFYHKWLLKSSSSCILAWKYIPVEGILILPKELKDFDIFVEDKPIEKSPLVRNLIWKIHISNESTCPTPRLEFPSGSGIMDLHGASNFGDEMKRILEEELKNSLELLELEPDSKWTLSSALDIMLTLDFRKYYDDIFKFIDQLLTLDPFRKGYYNDMRSKINTQYYFSTPGINRFYVNMSELFFTGIDFPQYFYEACEVDLSKNNLQSLSGLRGYLNRCQVLNVNGNNMLFIHHISDLLTVTETLKKLKIFKFIEKAEELVKEYSHIAFEFF
uniref:Geranylgeranyl transferase type-2 subunit alpha n=1 Tax=Lepeophtheirus salmonis TaxID=72036 RepID=C1BRZ4_LEPSM|nr:Geranylgeranyl transferase type-2 subunit alpha [Lepeophtheirus salmonis]